LGALVFPEETKGLDKDPPNGGFLLPNRMKKPYNSYCVSDNHNQSIDAKSRLKTAAFLCLGWEQT